MPRNAVYCTHAPAACLLRQGPDDPFLTEECNECESGQTTIDHCNGGGGGRDGVRGLHIDGSDGRVEHANTDAVGSERSATGCRVADVRHLSLIHISEPTRLL